ncbi:MAG: hypothetical protein IJ025_05445 [Clostridia bacterium]|nr:hypothetical protein [Clostridia bacterium]
MKKGFFEKIGDTMLSTGKRSLIFALILVAVFLPAFTPLMEIAMVFVIIIGIPVFWSLLSFIAIEKSRLVQSFTLTLSDGTEVPCVVMKRQHYLRNPFALVSFLSPFCFIPFKTQYYLLIDVNQKEIDKSILISDTFLELGVINSIELCHKKAKAVKNNPQILSEEISGFLCKQRVAFGKFVTPYLKNDIVKILHSGALSTIVDVCGSAFLFKYSGNEKEQMGIELSDWESVRDGDENFLRFYDTLGRDPGAYLNLLGTFNGNVLMRALLNKSEIKTQAVIENAVRIKGEDDRNEIDEARIGRILFKKRAKGNAIAAGICCFMFVEFLLAAIACLAMGSLDIALFSFVSVPPFLIAFIINNSIKKKKRRTFTKDDYVIEEVLCTSSQTESVNEIGSIIRKVTFSNGETFSSYEDIEQGDLCYWIYSTREKQNVSYYFSAISSKLELSLIPQIKKMEEVQKVQDEQIVK